MLVFDADDHHNVAVCDFNNPSNKVAIIKSYDELQNGNLTVNKHKLFILGDHPRIHNFSIFPASQDQSLFILLLQLKR